MTMLTNKAIFITGAGRGIGLGIAEAVLESGGRVVLADLNADALPDVKNALVEQGAITTPTFLRLR